MAKKRTTRSKLRAGPSVGAKWRNHVAPAANPDATIAELAEARIARLAASRSKSVADYTSKYRRHVIPAFGTMKPSELTVRDVAAWVSALNSEYMPRTVHATHAALRALLEEAVAAGLAPSNAARLPRGALPRRNSASLYDLDAETMTPAEVGLLLTSTSIPEARRVLYAVLYLTGARFGEAAALTWRHWNQDARPLGRMTIEQSWSDKNKRVDTTKTDQVKRVPVHGLLESMLVYWQATGFERTFRRKPRPTDWLVPRVHRRRTPDIQHEPIALRRFSVDLVKIGLRVRRLHSSRHTFVTMMHESGADPYAVHEMTHPSESEGDAHMQYIRKSRVLTWDALCEAMGHLTIPLP